MLVLTRLKGEAIVIGGGLVRVEVVDVRGDKVRIGVTADRNIDVNREEVFNDIQRQAAEARAKAAQRAAKVAEPGE